MKFYYLFLYYIN